MLAMVVISSAIYAIVHFFSRPQSAGAAVTAFAALIAAGAGLILLPNLPLIKIQLYSQAINGVAIAPVLIFMLLLVNKKELMGEFVNSKLYNAVAWGLTGVMGTLSVPFIWDTLKQLRH